MARISAVAGLAVLVLLASTTTRAYQEGQVDKAGALTGVVRIRGPVPRPYVIHVTRDAKVFGRTIPDERLLVSPEGRIKNVVVMLEGIRQGKPWPDLRPTLVNQDGRFIPHVQATRKGERLAIVNRDPVLHNTHGFQGGRTIFNVALPQFLRGRAVSQPLREAGIVEVMCDVHDWMNGWIVVLEHPYVAITDAEGAYVIAGIPPGSYTVTAWHEQLGRRQARVEIPVGGRAQLDFVFSSSTGR